MLTNLTFLVSVTPCTSTPLIWCSEALFLSARVLANIGIEGGDGRRIAGAAGSYLTGNP